MDTLITPSLEGYDGDDMSLLRCAAEVGFVRFHDEPRTLASGRKSRVYVHGRADTTENPDFLYLASRKVLRNTRSIMRSFGDNRRPRFIGIPHVAHGWTPAFSMVDRTSFNTSLRAGHAIMRSERKNYGGNPGHWVEGEPKPKIFCDILFDNVVTDSGSKKTAAERLVQDGWDLSDVIAMVFVDRQQGGMGEMQRIGFRHVHACYRLLDMTLAFQNMNMWPDDAVEKVRQEIEQNQIAA